MYPFKPGSYAPRNGWYVAAFGEEVGFSEAPEFCAKPFYSHHIKGRYQLLNDNLLDLTHLGYLHSTRIGTSGDAATPAVLGRRALQAMMDREQAGVPA